VGRGAKKPGESRVYRIPKVQAVHPRLRLEPLYRRAWTHMKKSKAKKDLETFRP